MTVDYLIIGHVTQDLLPDGVRFGGTALYTALTAQRLGWQVGLVTCLPLSLELDAALPGVHLHCIDSERATTFENHYQGDDRRQQLHHVAPALTLAHVPEAWRRAPVVHLAPVAREVDPALAAHFPHSLLCATPQGWLRGWDEQGQVHYRPLENPRRQLQALDLMVFSVEDVNHDPAAMRALIRAVPIAVVTQAARGAVLYNQDGARPIPARPAQVVDPTGAGDVFAAAFFTRLYECRDPLEAAAFANVVASLSIEKPGASGIPTHAEVDAWFDQRTGKQ